MSQYYGRIHIKVKEPQIWERFKDTDDANFDLADLASTNQTSFVYDDDWCVVEFELEGIVAALAKTLGEDGIIIADTTNANVDPYIYCVFYLGDTTHIDYFSVLDKSKKVEKMLEISIEDIATWLDYGKFKISQKEQKVLFGLGLASVAGSTKEFLENIYLPDKIYLRETGFDNRPENIEKLIVSENVSIIHSKSKYDATRLEVKNSSGSLGYLPSDISDRFAPLILIKKIKYTAKVVEVVHLSQRNKHAKSPIVAISIEL